MTSVLQSLIVLTALISGAGSQPQSAASAPDLSGLWMSEQRFGPLVEGQLTINERENQWSASIAGFDVSADRRGDQVHISLPDDLGELRAHMGKDGTIRGYWIQPVSAILFQHYATPVTLAPVAPSVWRGDVLPLRERLSFYISISRQAGGELVAILRNPEFGWFNGFYHVDIENNSVKLSNRSGQLDGRFDPTTGQLLLNLIAGSPSPVVLARVNETAAVGFFPRVPRHPIKYEYSTPIMDNDGWKTASLQDVGLDQQQVMALVQSILDADPNDPHTVPVHSLLIARHGRLALEEYFYGFTAERTHNMRSAGKTLGPILLGVARDHGAKIGPATPVYSLFPQYKPFANWDDRKSRITVEDIMTMRPGWACDDNDSASPGNENNLQSQPVDWYKYTLDLPMARDPGGNVAIYCSASLNLVGGVAEQASGTWNADLFYDYIAVPLQFSNYHLNLMPSGAVYTGGGAELRPRDELKLGQVYLSGGVWNGRRVISTSWVRESTTAHSHFDRLVVAEDVNHEYGYGWHIHTFTVAGRSYREYAAEGAGGQFVIVMPDIDTVVGINAGDYRSADWYTWMLDLIPQFIVPAATQR